MNYRALIEGKHRQVCEFCYVWNPRGKQFRTGAASTDVRRYICSKGHTGAMGEHEVPGREFINEPCLSDDWLVCPLNPLRKL